MPKKLHNKLVKSYTKRKREGKLKGVSKDQYVYGGMKNVEKGRKNKA